MGWTQADLDNLQARKREAIAANREALAKGPTKPRKGPREARKPSRHEESGMQKQCVTWFKLQYKNELLFSVPNGSHLAGSEKERAIQVNILKAEGMLGGVSDLILVSGGGVYFLEAKTPDGIQRPNQKEFEEAVKDLGYKYFIFRSLKEFQGIVKQLIEKQ